MQELKQMMVTICFRKSYDSIMIIPMPISIIMH